MRIVDMHNHVLPGIDDGSVDMKMTLRMLAIAAQEGITDIVVTPHYKKGRKNASPAKVEALMEEVNAKASALGIQIRLHRGNEVAYFSEMEEDLEEQKFSTMNGSEYVLVEFLPGDSYTYIRNALYEVMSAGLSPIIAHVERYECMVKNVQRVAELKAMGVLVQINASSVTGALGWGIKHYIHKLLKEGLVDFIATDAHSDGTRRPAVQKCLQILKRKYDEEYVQDLFYANAEKYFL